MPNYRLVIEYDGTKISGWQIQPNGRSVQEDLEKCLAILLKEKVKVVGAGRTDAGVHASGQVAHFISDKPMDVRKIRNSLNGMLEKDITIHSLEEAASDFHARYSAKYREYHYHIYTGKKSLYRDYLWGITHSVDWEKVEAQLPYLTGKHNFEAFCASGSEAKTKDCNIHFVKLEKNGNDIVIKIRANRFLYKMVRSLVGTLVDIGKGSLPEENLKKALETGERSLVGATAPAKGLVLVEVGY